MQKGQGYGRGVLENILLSFTRNTYKKMYQLLTMGIVQIQEKHDSVPSHLRELRYFILTQD